MNKKLGTGLGIICFILGGVYFINSIFVAGSTDLMDAIITRVVYISIGLSFFGVGYLLIKKKQIKTEKALI